jgi:hypothetical protein
MTLYSCNTRISCITFLQLAVPLALFLPLMPDFNECFDQFLAKTLNFEDQYHTLPHAASYQHAEQPSEANKDWDQASPRLFWPLLTAPVASYVALQKCRQWYIQHGLLWGAEAISLFP